MTDIYRDTDERYLKDPAFYSAVRTLEAIAREHGFTPGELKQIAFKAALNIEEKRDGQRLIGTTASGATVHGLRRYAPDDHEPEPEREA